MSKECIFAKQTGLDHCAAEFMGKGAMRLCCSGQGDRLTTLQLMAFITNHSQEGDIRGLIGYDDVEEEDTRIVRLVNDLRNERDVPIQDTDDGYIDCDELPPILGIPLTDLRNFLV